MPVGLAFRRFARSAVAVSDRRAPLSAVAQNIEPIRGTDIAEPPDDTNNAVP